MKTNSTYFTYTITLITSLILHSCGTSSHYFSIDYMEPGKLLFPERIASLAILDNTQTNDISYQSDNLNVLKLNTTDIFNGFITNLAETEYYTHLILTDPKWKKEKSIIEKDQLSKMGGSLQTDADAIIILEQLNLRDNNHTILYPEPYTTHRVILNPLFQIYNIKKNTVSQIVDSDTIDITDALYFMHNLPKKQQLSTEDYALTVPYILGKSLAKLFAPHWTTEERMLYTDSPTFKVATKHYLNNEFEEAIQAYMSLANRKDKPVNSIKAAYNAAISYEIIDHLEEASVWANKALELAQTHFKRADTELSITLFDQNEVFYNCLLYTKLITKRLKDKQLLDQQMKRFAEEK